MTRAITIPDDYQTLVGLLRDAIARRPPSHDWQAVNWPVVFTRARQHGVATFLYPWLAEHASCASASASSADFLQTLSAWREHFLTSVLQTLERQRELASLLAMFADAKMEVAPLKGAWLSEHVYDDPAQRSMSDLDLLVRKQDVQTCHRLLTADGYFVEQDMLLNPFASDQPYFHSIKPTMVELHWNFASESEPLIPSPDMEAIWQAMRLDTVVCFPVRVLSLEDQLAHLVQHMLHHRFAVPLRGYLDIALFLQKLGEDLSSSALDAASLRWRTGAALPFVAHLASELLDSPLPASLSVPLKETLANRLDPLAQTLFRLPPASLRGCEQTMLRLRKSSPAARLRVIASRIFMPRAYLTIRYPYARCWALLPFVWMQRIIDLLAKTKRRGLCTAIGTTSGGYDLIDDADIRDSTIHRLLHENEKPG